MNKFSTIIIYAYNPTLEIKCNELIDIADRISLLLDYKYDKFGYSLLHPDYAYKEIGKFYTTSIEFKKAFSKEEIPLLCHGVNLESPTSPEILFFSRAQTLDALPDYQLSFRYPAFESNLVEIELDVNIYKLKSVSMAVFSEIIDIIQQYNFGVNSAYVHSYYNSKERAKFTAGSCSGICGVSLPVQKFTNKIAKFRFLYPKKLFDIFELNAANREIMDDEIIESITSIIGSENIYIKGEIVYFSLTCARGIPVLKKIKIKRLLKNIVFNG